jgi:hypothetical protein
MLPRIPRPSGLVWYPAPLVGSNRANLLKVSLVAAAVLLAACLLALVGTTKPAGATFPGQNGKIAYIRWDSTDTELYTINPDGTGETNLTNNSADESGPVWSPYGTIIAYIRWDGTDYEIYTINSDGTGETNLTNDTASEIYPVWSPDGTKIAYEFYDGTDTEIYTINSDGTGETNLTNDGTDERSPTWSPDGTTSTPTARGKPTSPTTARTNFGLYGHPMAPR